MATLDSWETVRRMLENAGEYTGYQKALQIAAYYNKVSNTTRYHVAYLSNDIDDLHGSPFVGIIKILWRHTEGLTKAGKDFLAGKLVL